MTLVSPGDDVDAAPINFMSDRTIDRPMCRVVASAAQAMANNTIVTLLFGAEDYDLPGGMHDITTNTSRIVPPTGFSGYYEFKGTVIYVAGSDYLVVDAFFKKNGTTLIGPPGRRSETTGSVSSYQVVSITCTVFLDPAAGDYVELQGVQTNTAAASRNTNFAAGVTSLVEAKFVHR